MQFNVKSNTLFFSMLIMIFTPPTFAPWSDENPPGPPLDGQQRTCTQWINYHGFTLGNYDENRAMTLTRAYKLDKEACTWAAIYAFLIDVVVSTNELLPEAFCNYIGSGQTTYSYTPLKDEIRTCRGWIQLYMFSPVYTTYNLRYALNQSIEKNYAISIWAESYSSYLAEWRGYYAVSPSQFCTKLGKTVDQGDLFFMQFMSENDTFFTCEAWIKLYEYANDVEVNYNRATKLNAQIKIYFIPVQYWMMKYAEFIVNAYFSDIPIEEKTPREYCRSQNKDLTATYNFYYNRVYPESLVEEYS